MITNLGPSKPYIAPDWGQLVKVLLKAAQPVGPQDDSVSTGGAKL